MKRRTFLGLLGLLGCKDQLEDMKINKKFWWLSNQQTSETLGFVVDEDYTTMANLSNYTEVSPASTFAITGGYLNLSYLPGAGGIGNYLTLDSYGSTMLTKFTHSVKFYPRNNTSTSFGLSIGVRYTDSVNQKTVSLFFNQSTSADKGKIRIDANGANVSGYSSAVSFSVNDEIILELVRNENQFTGTAYNITTGLNTSVSYTFPDATTTTSAGKFTIFANGGLQDVAYQKVYTTNLTRGLCFIGDSITYGIRVTYAQRYVTLIDDYSSKNVNKLATPGAWTQDVLNSIGSELYQDTQSYKDSRADWEKAYTQGLDLLGFKYEQRTEPFQGASSATHPVLAEAVTQFQALAYKELLPAGGPVRTQVVGLGPRNGGIVVVSFLLCFIK